MRLPRTLSIRAPSTYAVPLPQAREHFQEANRLEPGLSSVYDSWGRMEASLGQHRVAASLFERGLELRPSARLCHALGVLLDTQGEPEKARDVLQRGLCLPNEADNPQLLHASAIVEARAGRVGGARSLLLSVVSRHPSFTKAYLTLGQLEERMGNTQAARRHYERGATAQHNDGRQGAVQLWQSWARLEARLGRPRKALSVYRRAAALFPADEQLIVGWARLEAEHGDEDTARGLYTRVTEM